MLEDISESFDPIAYNEAYEAENQHKERVKHIFEFMDEAIDFLENGTSTYGDTLPWHKTEDKFRLRHSEVTLWAAQNGAGKSMVTSQLACHLSSTTKVGIASFEMKPLMTVARVYRQAIACPNPTVEYCQRANEQLDLFIYDHVGSVTPVIVFGMIRYMAVDLGIKHIFIDSLMKCGVNSQENEPQKKFVSALQDLAKEHQIHIHLIHHLRKGKDANAIPDKYSVKGAGELVDLVDNLVLVYRDRDLQNKKAMHRANNEHFEDMEKSECKLIIDKQRHGDYEGSFIFWWHEQSYQWVDNSRGEKHFYIK